MNKIILIGNLTREPELAETPNGTAVCKFDIAVNRPYAKDDSESVDYFPIIVWRTLAENVSKYCRKGSKVCVEGSMQMRRYEDKNGNKRISAEVQAVNVEFLSNKTSKAENDSDDTHVSSVGKGKPKLEPYDDDEDMPF